jgi:hypothetical protein
MSRITMLLLICVQLFGQLNCMKEASVSQEGGSGVDVECIVVGCITDSSGAPASNTLVRLIKYDEDPFKPIVSSTSLDDTTDNQGRVSMHNVPDGTYNIQALNLESRTSALRCSLKVDGDSVNTETTILRRPGCIHVILPAGIDRADGYLYVPGTTIAVMLPDTGASMIIDSIPAANLPSLSIGSFVNSSPAEQLTIRQNISVSSDDTALVAMPLWRFSRKLVLNTTSSGANVMNDVTEFPVLVRLSSSNFSFDDAGPHGEDIRLAKSDGTPLAYEIEQWDVQLQEAAIWVKVDTVYGNNADQSISMYWGNQTASSLSNSSAVFDTGSGFQGVWHMNGLGGEVVDDATVNDYNGTPSGMSAASMVSGAIGSARYFDGLSSYVRMVGSASGKLNFPQDGRYTISVWVRADTATDSSQVVMAKGNRQYFVNLRSGPNWEFVDWQAGKVNEKRWATASPREWTYLVAVKDGNTMHLYCNGISSDIAEYDTQTSARDESFDFSIGRSLQSTMTQGTEGLGYFKGVIDEVRASNIPQSSDFVKLSYMNQKSDDALVFHEH